ncbi:tagatose-bisphosphate aldolase [Clostridium beijerinckii]|uniref:Tagatose-bisphosphate aldolase n=1 Tax=Clostridium beijerinckii TaxID=1520 RepID=A0A0B5QLR2_CLOBE|nr:class II D-tagatose-bisphosphate aldolase, non-catalytic subunit [Clostridium beijerinckii]AJH01811.1 tagatose-bisphosphate aldolase [Clostridium beijerinckii]
MFVKNPMLDIVKKQKNGIKKGIYSACTANEYVIEAVLERALKAKEPALIEATANQVNQFGGYTGMKPKDYVNFILEIAKKVGFPKEKIILGGDHLGPLTWIEENASEAMKKSKELIREYVLAGFTKIHIDTSMKVADDKKSEVLDTAVIAERGAVLCEVAEEAYKELLQSFPDAIEPVYVVGSEVPIPGGAQEEESIQVTKVEDFEATVETFKNAFYNLSLHEAWKKVIGVVVQPGVEFGNESVHEYNREAARELTRALSKYDNILFEGHSTDYQTADSLKRMVEDGIAILKVGPALTFALREGLFALSYMENELFKYDADVEISNFIEVLDKAMIKNPSNWRKHYHGAGSKIKYARKYSYSDRSRYYFPTEEVIYAQNILIKNMKSVEIPLTLINQFMPIQYNKIRNGLLRNDPEELIKDLVVNCIDEYIYASTPSEVSKQVI